MAMLGVGYITRYCGMDATIGMAMSHTGVLFPFFGTIIGWVGVALSGSEPVPTLSSEACRCSQPIISD